VIIQTEMSEVRLESRCAKRGCERIARWSVTASISGVEAVTFSCDEHRPDQEVHAIRMFADC
jgi:hypothetical protein